MRSRKRASESGFTLIELLVGVAIISLIMGTVYVTLSQTLLSIEHSNDYLARLRMTDLAFNRLQRELMSAFYPLDDQSLVFLGKDAGVAEGAADTLTFHTRMGSLSYLVSSGVYEVSYGLRDDPEAEGDLLVWAGAPLRSDEPGEAKEIVLADGIKALNFSYFFQKDWHDVFDAESKGMLPQAVKVELGLLTDQGVQWQELVIEVMSGGERMP